jgi:hypothetical protein
MKRFLLAILLLPALAAAAILALNQPGAQASPDPTITVNNTADTNARNPVITLREALMLATGDLTLADLTHGECDQVSDTHWGPVPPYCRSTADEPDAGPADTIVFDAGVFPPGSPHTVALGGGLPLLDTGGDTVDGSGAGVIVQGSGVWFSCFVIDSSNNTIKGLEIHSCQKGISLLEQADDTTIGGSTDAERNAIYGNSFGVHMTGVRGVVVTGNYIGTDAEGETAIPNQVGIYTIDASEIIIGGSSDAERNVISGNESTGLHFNHSGHSIIAGNYIGTNADGDVAVPNGGGIYLGAGVDNTIGGTAPGEGNLIAYNNGDGVRVEYVSATGNAIRGNSIHSNGGLGIENIHGGNTELAPPVIDSAVGSAIGTACPNCTVDIYSDDEDEGRVYEGSTTANGAGNWSFSGSLEGPNITATATDADGNTSEFSDPVEVTEETETPTPTPTPTPTATPGATPTPAGTTRTLQWNPGWQNATWSGASTPAEVFACAAGKYAAAYRFTDAGLERYFPDRPDISDMNPLAQYDAFLILITQPVTCVMPVTAASVSSRTLQWGIGWQNAGWSGPDGTLPEQAFACADSSYAAAYRYVDGGLERYFPGRPDISNMGPLNKYDAFLILVTAPVSCTMAIGP